MPTALREVNRILVQLYLRRILSRTRKFYKSSEPGLIWIKAMKTAMAILLSELTQKLF